MKLIKTLFSLFFLFTVLCLNAQIKVPDIYSDIFVDENGKVYHKLLGLKFYEQEFTSYHTLKNMQGEPEGTKNGITFNFRDVSFNGSLYYGLIDYTDSKHPMPVWFKLTATIENGKAEINIQDNLSGKYDMSGWGIKGYGTLGYRVADSKGDILYDGIISFEHEKSSFTIITTITEGPFVNLIDEKSAVISFETNFDEQTSIKINGKEFKDDFSCKHHEIKISGLLPSSEYKYLVEYGRLSQAYKLKTSPKKGERKPFVFAYTSDSRGGQGGGEHNLYGANFYVMKKIAALAMFNDVAFMQFTGDMVNGYTSDKRDINLQYANWKRAVEPWAHYFPIITGMGNHEFNGKIFVNKNGAWRGAVCGFPFESESSSAVFATNFVNPTNGPKSEDGAYYDPDPNQTNFPPYDETVFYYTYDNVAVVVLNSDYWYSPTLKYNHRISGNLHAYIMDVQLDWLEKTIIDLEADSAIDHVFITQHTPAFPNGGHVEDDMWYGGKNKYRPYVAGEPVKKGIIERRDEYLNIIINKSTKVIALMTGDEHNYNKLKISPDVNLYPETYEFEKLIRKRTIWQINNGSAGAPYYAQDKNTPWADAVSGFTTQQALVLIYVYGNKVSVKVMNPDTLELIDEYILRY